jgi:hypothetical protein
MFDKKSHPQEREARRGTGCCRLRSLFSFHNSCSPPDISCFFIVMNFNMPIWDSFSVERERTYITRYPLNCFAYWRRDRNVEGGIHNCILLYKNILSIFVLWLFIGLVICVNATFYGITNQSWKTSVMCDSFRITEFKNWMSCTYPFVFSLYVLYFCWKWGDISSENKDTIEFISIIHDMSTYWISMHIPCYVLL